MKNRAIGGSRYPQFKCPLVGFDRAAPCHRPHNGFDAGDIMPFCPCHWTSPYRNFLPEKTQYRWFFGCSFLKFRFIFKQLTWPVPDPRTLPGVGPSQYTDINRNSIKRTLRIAPISTFWASKRRFVGFRTQMTGSRAKRFSVIGYWLSIGFWITVNCVSVQGVQPHVCFRYRTGYHVTELNRFARPR